MQKMGWKTKLGGPDSEVKRRIFGTNSARIYNYKVQAEYEALGHDKLTLMKEHYEAEGVERNNVTFGFVGNKTAA